MMSRTMREAHCDPTWRVAHQFRPEIEMVRACLRSADSSGGSNSGSDEGEAEIGSLVLSLRVSLAGCRRDTYLAPSLALWRALFISGLCT